MYPLLRRLRINRVRCTVGTILLFLIADTRSQYNSRALMKKMVELTRQDDVSTAVRWPNITSLRVVSLTYFFQLLFSSKLFCIQMNYCKSNIFSKYIIIICNCRIY